ncbi:hypothetical protein [Deminuibacter soli]|uniref:Uncharacterized protein n=1 Tax=Deminuibacter soli TaxID=2291815 RepID=A0A3E1NG62_9BACT|nr:hypothetical protein [Deminuibacter soli]RFM26778.1 hypothetical protein DXN05_17445 [Deminuibacter soli]
MLTQNKRLVAILLTVAILLCVPLVAMQFTSEVSWKWPDFVVAGILLSGTGLLCELVLRKVKKMPQRLFICLAVLAVAFLIWVELAVGIFGTPFAGH